MFLDMALVCSHSLSFTRPVHDFPLDAADVAVVVVYLVLDVDPDLDLVPVLVLVPSLYDCACRRYRRFGLSHRLSVYFLFQRRVLQKVDIGFVGDITAVNTRVSWSVGQCVRPSGGIYRAVPTIDLFIVHQSQNVALFPLQKKTPFIIPSRYSPKNMRAQSVRDLVKAGIVPTIASY